MVCLDTTILVDLLRRQPSALEKLKRLEDSGEDITTTPVNIIEIYVGAYRSERIGENMEKAERLIDNLTLLELGREESRFCASTISNMLSDGEPIGTMDVIAGCVALSHGEAMVTRNARHYRRIEGLNIETY